MEANNKVRWGAIVTEKDSTRENSYKLSMGRSMGWIMFILMMVLWSKGIMIPDSLMVVFLSMMGYNLGGKISPAINTVIERGMDSRETRQSKKES